MMVTLGFLGGETVEGSTLALQGLGALVAGLVVVWVCRNETVRLPFAGALRGDSELQVFVALLFCFGFAMVASLLHVSAALGAFLAGLVVGAAKETRPFHEHLKPFEVVFVASFFVSIGVLIDLAFLREHWALVAGLVLVVLVTNTGINAAVLRLLGGTWRTSLYAASLLAQIGEFSFVLALVGNRSEIIGSFGYQMTLSTISLSLLASPFWIAAVRRLTHAEVRAG